MRIAIVGPGAIGSTFAYQLSRAEHDVTVIARGERLRFLETEQAIVLGSGERAAVKVAAVLDESVEWDLVLVTVLAPQVAAILPTLRASRVRAIMFMFNTFESLEPLREAVGASRFAFGFPAGVFTLLVTGRIHPQIRQGTTVGDARWATLFTEAGIPTVVDDDMQSWLRAHAALVAPLMAAGTIAFARNAGLSWSEAAAHAVAMRAGARIVRAAGNDIRPSYVRYLLGLPVFMLAPVLWAMSRTKMLRDLGALGTAEPRMLIDMMSAASPDLAAPLRAVRP